MPELSYLVYSISLWTSTSFVHMMPLGWKLALPGGQKLEHRNSEAHLQKFYSLKLEGVELWYLVCSISLWISIKFVHMMPLGSKLASPQGAQVGTRTNEDQFQNSSSLKLGGLELRYLASSIWQWTFIMFFFFFHMMPLGSKLALPQGSQVRTIRTKKVELVLWGEMTQVSDPGPSWPSCLTMFSTAISLVRQNAVLCGNGIKASVSLV